MANGRRDYCRGHRLHAVLILSLRAYLTGSIGESALVAIQIVNPAIPMMLVGVMMRREAAHIAR